MPAWICRTCGVQHPDTAYPPQACAICEDERQYVGWDGQQLCEDMHGPWGDAATPVAGRIAATRQQWPSTPVVAVPLGRELPAVPVLLPAGDHDLSTPLPWAQQEAVRAPRAHLVVNPGSGHGTQHSINGPMGRAAATAFLTAP